MISSACLHPCLSERQRKKYLKQGIEEYLKRLTPYSKVEITEVAGEKALEELIELEMEQVKQKEGERLKKLDRFE